MLSSIRKFQSKIFAKVLLFVCASILVILFSSFYVFDRLEYDDKTTALIKQQKFITQSQAIIIPQYILDHDEERITLILSGILSNPIIIGVAIYATDGQILYRFGKFESETYRVFNASHNITNFDGSGVHSLGRLETVATDRHIVEALERRRDFYGIVFIILFFAIVVATYSSIHLIVAIPLNRLVAAIKKSRDGMPISVDWKSRDEIGLVFREFQNLQDRQFEVQAQLRHELDRREKILTDLRKMKDAAEQASRAKTEFLATMSHELRTPLNAIIGFSEVIKDEAFGRMNVPQYREYSIDIHNSGIHLLAIINDILDMSKIEAGEMTPDEKPFDLAQVAGAAVRLISEDAAKRNIELISDVPDDLPAFYGDQRMIKQILINLLSNAVKFTPEKGRIKLAASADADGFRISVADNGIGIPADKIETVLEPFGQVDSRLERAYEGTGLGLPLVKSMVKLHGGGLAIDSRVGVGTTIEIRFPASCVYGAPAEDRPAKRIA